MITNALNSAVQGMRSQAVRFQHIGNNIANSDTTGYKSGTVSFAEALTTIPGGGGPDGAKTQPGAGVLVTGTRTDFTTGQIEDDGNQGHLSVLGDGFFTVDLDGTEYVTRAGDFSLVEDPNNAGNFVMMRPNGSLLVGSSDATNAATSGIVSFATRPASIRINATGAVTGLDGNGATITPTNPQLRMRRFLNPDALTKWQGQNYAVTADATEFVGAASGAVGLGDNPGSGQAGFLRQGSLEKSNVDLTVEFTRMITTQRNYQANSKTITTASDMLNTAINLIR